MRDQLAASIVKLLRGETGMRLKVLREAITRGDWEDAVDKVSRVSDARAGARHHALGVMVRFGVSNPDELTLVVLARSAHKVDPKIIDMLLDCPRAHSQLEADAIYRAAMITQQKSTVDRMNMRGILPSEDFLAVLAALAAPMRAGAQCAERDFFAQCIIEWEAIRLRKQLSAAMTPPPAPVPATFGL